MARGYPKFNPLKGYGYQGDSLLFESGNIRPLDHIKDSYLPYSYCSGSIPIVHKDFIHPMRRRDDWGQQCPLGCVCALDALALSAQHRP